MEFRKEIPLMLVALSLLVGCGDRPFIKPEANDESMIIGYIDMADAPGSFNGVHVKRIQPVSKTPYYNFWIDGGMFYRSPVAPGVYKMDSFSSYSRWSNTNYTLNFPKSGRSEMDLKITKPGVYYVGSWKYAKVKTGFFEHGKFDLIRIEKPTELDLLKQVLPKAKDPYWVNMINKRIKELQK